MERTLVEQLEEAKETRKRLEYFVAGMRYGAKTHGSHHPDVVNALDFDDFDAKYKAEHEGI